MEDINKKVDNIVKLSSLERYKYFIRKVADFETVWGLYSDGWAMASDNNSNSIVFWPEKIFAEKCIDNQWENYKPKSINIDDYLNKWIPGMEKDNLNAIIFYTAEDKGIVVSPSDLKKDIVEELGDYD
ncbi:DUF2750 domain-containing protein [uncultured Flavobacterium sp.]|uniref:DUF2750 domain-containing protein n=1 Tax=uncultured Flavobacterium sp. TaxID=165435 RepID=UPI0025D29301|nr:DUF2750 domain-containing protein [uncultured Flavobacterium sp.]